MAQSIDLLYVYQVKSNCSFVNFYIPPLGDFHESCSDTSVSTAVDTNAFNSFIFSVKDNLSFNEPNLLVGIEIILFIIIINNNCLQDEQDYTERL